MPQRKLAHVGKATPVGTRVAWVNPDFVVVITRTKAKPESVHGDLYVALSGVPGLWPAPHVFVLTDKDLELS